MTELKYREERDKVWKDTLGDGTRLFTAFTDVMKENDNQFGDTIENSDATCLRKFTHQTAGPNKEFAAGQLLYSKTEEVFVKVCKVTNNSWVDELNAHEPCGTMMHVLNLEDDSVRAITSEEEFSEFQDFITLNLAINYNEEEPAENLEIKHYLKNSFGTTFNSVLDTYGCLLSWSFKFFCGGKEIKKDMYSSQALFVKNDARLYVILHSPEYVFRRFKSVYKYRTSNSADKPNEIIVIPSTDLFLTGFWTYRPAGNENSYNLRYEVVIDGISALEDSVIADKWEDEVYYRLKFRKHCFVEKHSKVLLRCWITDIKGSNDEVWTYWGDDGLKYNEINNEHKYILRIEDAPSFLNQNQETWVMCGQFGEIYYTF